ncbi:MAG TPA: serine/threonine-protein kinase [Polyangiales bacterium]|nr:serine/threonine-protein kinase [Polyangiales bacterium]
MTSWRYTGNPEGSAEQSRELQDRIGRFARTVFAISGVMLLAAFVITVASDVGPLETLRRQADHIAAELLALGAWWLCRGKRQLPLPLLNALDALLTFGLCAAWAVLGVDTVDRDPVEFTIMLATTYTLIMRAVLVPSSFLRTLWIHTLAVLPTALIFLVRQAPFSPEASLEERRIFLFFSMLWCGVAVLTSAMLSRMLFGLRERIREIRQLGQYTLAEKIGEGGMGVVYRATHAFLRRPAAIKLLLPGRASASDLARFEREVQHTSQLAHPNTISILDYGHSEDGVFYYVMEYIDGVDLERLIDSEGPLDAPRAVHILAQASGALAEAHLQGLVHRDIKPANIMLTARVDEPDVVKVVDFGLVKTVQALTDDESAVTFVDALIGTPTCLAPEAITAPDSVDGRADIYALGVVGYFILTGKRLFEAKTVVEICSKHLTEAPVPPSVRLGRPIAADLERVILDCLAKSRDDRPASAQALRARLLGCSDAARYDAETAREWWRVHAERVRRSSQPAPEPHAATIAIDLSGRKAG